MITEENLKQKLHEIAVMDLLELRQCWREEIGSEPFGKSAFFLRQRLAFKIQERLLGGHSDFICRKIREFAENENSARTYNGLICGSSLSRMWKQKKYILLVVKNGFMLDGKKYRSLSGAAYAITGTQWSGKLFWRVK